MAGGDQEILVGSALYIFADETEITEGDSIQFTVSPIALGEDIITIYINNVSVYNTQNPGSDILYVHTFNESGEFSVYAEAIYNNIQTQSIVITVEEDIIEPLTSVNWEINNKNVQSIQIGNKSVKNIKRDNVLIFGSINYQTWEPALNGETGATYLWSYSEADGEAVGKGFIFNNGFPNTSNWQLSFEFKHDNIRYTGICFLVELGNNYNGGGGNDSYSLTSWEGTWPNGERYATYGSGTVDWFDVTVTKIDSTHINLKSITLNRNTNVEVLWMENATYLSFGARHNDTSSAYGPCRIRNVKAIYGF